MFERARNFVRQSTPYIRVFARACRCIGRLFAGTFALYVLGEWFPILRENLPSLYTIVDQLMVILEKGCSFILPFLGLGS